MYPDDCIQNLIDSSWWIRDNNSKFKRGKLIKAYVPHVAQDPLRLVITGRVKPEDHKSAKFLVEPLRIRHEQKANKLPVAALPVYPGEELAIYRVKKRPLIIVSIGGDEIPRELCKDKPKWQTYPTILVAPFYGRDESGGESRFQRRVCQKSEVLRVPPIRLGYASNSRYNNRINIAIRPNPTFRPSFRTM